MTDEPHTVVFPIPGAAVLDAMESLRTEWAADIDELERFSTGADKIRKRLRLGMQRLDRLEKDVREEMAGLRKSSERLAAERDVARSENADLKRQLEDAHALIAKLAGKGGA